VRIALRMDIAFGARHRAGRNFQNSAKREASNIRRADLDFRIGGLRNQRGKPADFEFKSDDDEEIGAAQLEKKLGLASTKCGS